MSDSLYAEIDLRTLPTEHWYLHNSHWLPSPPGFADVGPHKFHLSGNSFMQADSRVSKDSRARVDGTGVNGEN